MNNQFYSKKSLSARILALSLVFCMLFLQLASEGNASSTNYQFAKANVGGVNFRNEVAGLTLTQINKNEVVQVLQSLKDSKGIAWYGVYLARTGQTGYVQSSFFTLLSQSESNNYAANNPKAISPTSISPNISGLDASQIKGYVETSSGMVNLRDRIDGGSITHLNRGEKFPYVEKTTSGGTVWYKIFHPQYGYSYLHGAFVFETEITNSNTTVLPSQPAPSTHGSITMTTDKVNVRSTAAQHGTRIGRVALGQTFILLEAPVQSDGFTWYKISANTIVGYVRGDMARFNNDATNNPNPSIPTAVPGFGYVITSMVSVALRNAADNSGLQLMTLGINTNLPLTGAPVVNGVFTWYPVNVNGTAGFVRSDAVQYYPAGSITTNTPAPSTNPGSPTNTLITTTDKVNLRVAPRFGTKAPYRVALGTILPYQSTQTVSGKLWYKVTYQNSTLWVLGTMVRVLGSNEAPTISGGVTTVPPATAQYIVTTKSSVNVRETPAGKTKGSIPAKGTVLQYLGTTASKNYTWYEIMYNNSKAYIRGDVVAVSDANGNIINTPAPPTNPSNPGSSSIFQLYRPVQKVDWNTGLINKIWPRKAVMPVMDVRTGKSFMMYRWAGGSHIDGEPYTKADTAILCSIYGVSKASQIVSNKHYHRRPMWVTINGVTYAASLYGVPHNPAGNAIKDNDYDGQMCLHFLNSRLHSSNKVDANHMAAVEEAFQKGR